MQQNSDEERNGGGGPPDFDQGSPKAFEAAEATLQ
jgi:hypothetical protein